MNEHVLALLQARSGHFLYESGHHGESWLDLETLCARPAELRPVVSELASRLASYKPEVICGPLVEGAFVGLLVAAELGCAFTYANRFAPETSGGLFPVTYNLPAPLRPLVKDKRVAIVNDVISAGSAVRGTFFDLQSSGARVVAVGSLAVLGESFRAFADEHGLPLEALATMPHRLWKPAECPLCAAGMTLEKLAIA
jgi:orotate phosphoribosyltransferase